MTQTTTTPSPQTRGAVSRRPTRLWHSQAHMPTIKDAEVVITRGEGPYVWTDTGQKLLDVPASLWYCKIGHGRREIADAVGCQMTRLESFSNFQQFTTQPSLELAERLSEIAPIRNSRIFFTSGGSDSIDCAAKLARRYWNATGHPDKQMIVSREGAYHGLHGFGTSITGIAPNREGLGDLIQATARVPANDADAFADLIEKHGADQIAAFFCEPIIGTGGVIHPADGYLQEIRRLCSENDILLVADEVITGFGRTGEMFASQRFGIEPDMITMAKGLTSGYLPLGAVCIAERIWEPFWDDGSELIFRHGITYSGHATACAAGLANLEILERESLVSHVRELEGKLQSALQSLNDHPLVSEVRSGIGLLAGIQVLNDQIAREVCSTAMENGVLTRMLSNSTIHVSPPFVIDEPEIALLADVIGHALDSVHM